MATVFFRGCDPWYTDYAPVGGTKPTCIWVAQIGLSGLQKKKRNEVGIRDSGREVDLGEVKGTGNKYHQIYTVYICDMILSWN